MKTPLRSVYENLDYLMHEELLTNDTSGNIHKKSCKSLISEVLKFEKRTVS